MLAREEGKTRAEGMGEVMRAARIFKYFAGEALRRHFEALNYRRSRLFWTILVFVSFWLFALRGGSLSMARDLTLAALLGVVGLVVVDTIIETFLLRSGIYAYPGAIRAITLSGVQPCRKATLLLRQAARIRSRAACISGG